MRKVFPVIIGLALIVILARHPALLSFFNASPVLDDQQIRRAYQNRQSDLQVRGEGSVQRILSDDTQGRCHPLDPSRP